MTKTILLWLGIVVLCSIYPFSAISTVFDFCDACDKSDFSKIEVLSGLPMDLLTSVCEIFSKNPDMLALKEIRNKLSKL